MRVLRTRVRTRRATSFQFRSYIEPLTVIVAIPLALIGVVAGHLIMGISLSMPSILGFVSLAGIVVNDSILLVLFLKQRRDEGADVLESARQASRKHEQFLAALPKHQSNRDFQRFLAALVALAL